MSVRIYSCRWDKIPKKEWPEPSQIFICKDPQERLGPETWIVNIMGTDAPGDDIMGCGLFWNRTNAELFAYHLDRLGGKKA